MTKREKIAWAILPLLVVMGLAAASQWDEPWAAELRCGWEGRVTLGERCYDATESMITLSADDLATADLAELARMPNLDTVFLDPRLIAEGFEGLPPLPRLDKVYVTDRSEGEPLPISLRGLDGVGPVTLFGADRVVLADAGPLADLPLERLAMEGSVIGPLPQLPNLRGLSFQETPLADLDVVRGAPMLRWLSYSGAPIPPLGPLAEAAALDSLHLGVRAEEPGLSDLSALARLASLRSLSLHGGGLSDLSPLATLPKLEELTLAGASGLDLSPLARIPGLEVLQLWRLSGTPLEPLAGAPNLKFLTLGGEEVSLAGLASETVTELTASTARSLSVAGLGPMPALERLRIEGVREVDLSSLPDLPSLESILIARADTALLDGLAAAPRLLNVNLDVSAGVDLRVLEGNGRLQILKVNRGPVILPDLASLTSLSTLELPEMPAEALAGISDLPLVGLKIDLPEGEDGMALLPLPELRSLELGRGTLTPALVSALPNLEVARGRGEDGDWVSLRNRSDIEAWLAEAKG